MLHELLKIQSNFDLYILFVVLVMVFILQLVNLYITGLSINSKAMSQLEMDNQGIIESKAPSYIDFWMHNRGFNNSRPPTPTGSLCC